MLDKLFKRLHGTYTQNTLRAQCIETTSCMSLSNNNALVLGDVYSDDIVDYIALLNLPPSTLSISNQLMDIRGELSRAHLSDTKQHPNFMLAITQQIPRQTDCIKLKTSPATFAVKAKLLEISGNDTLGLLKRVLLDLGCETKRRGAGVQSQQRHNLCSKRARN